jgi:hypothetical protein
MADKIGFAVAQRVEYGEYLETAFDGRYAICEKAVEHVMPDMNNFILRAWRAIDPDAEYELEKECKRLSLLAQTWAQENKPWTNRTGQAQSLLKGFLTIDGAYK